MSSASKIHVRLNALLPKLVGLKDRPKALNCTVTRFTFNQRKWIAFVGYLNDKPYEIFTGVEDDEMFPIPTSIVNGTIIREILMITVKQDLISNTKTSMVTVTR